MPPSMPLFTMILEVIRHTPTWVWAVLALLIALGGSQLRAHRLARLRVALLPLALGGYSLWGAISLFGLHTAVVLAWALAAGLAAWVARRFAWAPGIRHEPANDRFALPGSAWPLVLMLSVFAVRYGAAVTLAFHREWAGDMAFAAGASAVYGALSGLLAGRALYILGHARSDGPRGALGLAA